MVDFLQIFIEFLRVDSSWVSNYPTQLEQFLFVIFFPTILLILLIYLLMDRMFPEHRGLSILLGVSFYIFIIVYPPGVDLSLYAAFAPLGQFWYIFVVIVGLLWLFLQRLLPHRRRGQGGGAVGYATREGGGGALATIGSAYRTGRYAARLAKGTDPRLVTADQYVKRKHEMRGKLNVAMNKGVDVGKLSEALEILEKDADIFFNNHVNDVDVGNNIKRKWKEFLGA